MTRYFTILHYILITVVIYLGVDLFYTDLASRLDSAAISPTTNKQVSVAGDQASRSLAYYRAIDRRNLFNIKTNAPETRSTADTPRIEELKQTSLNLKLWGTVSGTDDRNYAVIESSGGEQNLYRVGDAIQTATVKLILRGKVILSIDGQDEVLEMEDLASRGKTSPRRVQPRNTSRRIPLRREQVTEATQNINQLLREVQVRPHFEKGKPDGLMLSRIKPNSIFRKMGLRNGDILRAVNGEPLVSVDSALNLYERLKSSDEVKVEIKRRGRLQTIEYRLD